MEPPGNVATVATLEKAIDILFHLHGEPEARGVTAIGRALGLPESSAHRLLAALSRRGLLERDDRGRYRTGMGLVALGLGALEHDPIGRAARPILESEARELGETVFLVAARAGRLVVLDKAEGTGFLRAAPQVGSTVPVHATAVGKLYLAFGPDAVEPVDDEPERFTDRTATSAEALAGEVERIRRQGFAENREEWIPGLAVVAAPVRVGGRLVGALAVAAPVQRLDALGREWVGEQAMAAAARVAARLEGSET